jgi:hypothetical protein
MKYLSFIIYTLIFLSILTPVAIVIFDFFNIKFESYGNYLLWVIALAIFNAILPVKTKNIFGDIVKPIEKLKEAAQDFGNKVLNKAGDIAVNVQQTNAANDLAAAAAAEHGLGQNK